MSKDHTNTQDAKEQSDANATYETNAEASQEAAAKEEAAESSRQAAEGAADHAQQQDAEAKRDSASAELEELRKQAEDNYQRFLRTQADFDNFRRRARQEKEDFAKYASLKLIEQLLPVVDNFSRAIAASKENRDFDALLKGLDMTYRQLDQVLAQEGLTPIDAVGQPFNPEFHQAVMQVESEEHGEGIVVEELQKGFMLKDKVIRPAMVKVSV